MRTQRLSLRDVESAVAASFEPFVVTPASVLQNVATIVEAVQGAPSKHLRRDFLNAMNALLGNKLTFSPAGHALELHFGHDDRLNERILAELMDRETLPDDWRYSTIEVAALRQRTHAALDLLHAVDAENFVALNTVVGALAFGRQTRYGGGSRSSAIGTICFSPRPAWSVEEYASHIFHEYVHQLLFVDDMVNQIFSVDGEVLGREESLITSAILKRRRPYDRAFHSAFVLFVMLQFFHRLGRPELAPGNIASLRVTIEEAEDNGHFLTEHGAERLASLRDAFERFIAKEGVTC